MANGLVVIVESIPHVESAAYDLLIPGGILTDDEERIGESLILAELTSRGAGNLDSRALSDRFDEHGIRHSESVGHDKFTYHGSLLADKLEPALELVGMMVREPMLPEDEIDSIKSILLQDIQSLKDNPARRAMVELSRRYYPGPYSRPSLGEQEGIEAVTIDSLRSMWSKHFRPAGSVLSVAGKVNPEEVFGQAEKLFGAWKGDAVTLPKFGTQPKHASYHIDFESAQLQITLAYPSAPFGDRHYYTAKVANGVLSGGMFGRLFIEVREKRGLCYSVFSRHAATKSYGTMLAYAGTTPERAAETLDVMVKELRSLRGTVEAEELSRAKANLKAGLIIGEESTSSRAGSNATDWWLDRRIRTLDEIQAEIDKVSTDSIDEFLKAYPADSFSLLTLGSKRIDVERPA